MNKQNTIIVSQITERKAIALDCQFDGAFQDMQVSLREFKPNIKESKLLKNCLDTSIKLAISAASNAHIN